MAKKTNILVGCIIGLVFITLALLVLSPFVTLYAARKQIAAYAGDGKIVDESFMVTFLHSPTTFLTPVIRYEIRFDEFSLQKPSSHSYTLKKLPILQQEPFLYLVAYNIPFKDKPLGHIDIHLTDDAGNTVVHLNEAIVLTDTDINPFQRDYRMRNVHFTPHKDKIYTLKIDFHPPEDPILHSSGQIRIQYQ